MKYLSFIALVMLISCKSSNLDIEKGIPIEEVLSEYPNGQLSIKDPILFSFKNELTSELVLGETIRTFPEINGEIKKLNAHTFALYPSANLDYGTDYFLTIFIAQLSEEYFAKEKVMIPFSTRPLEYSISPQGTVDYSAETSAISGTIFSSDWVKNESVKALLSTSENNTVINWNHSQNGKVHNYSIPNISRQDVEQEFSIIWKSRENNFSGEKTYLIKQKGAFELVALKVNRDNKSINLQFSDPVLKTQRIEGLITITGEEPISNYNISGSSIVLYLSGIFSDKKELTITDKIKSYQSASLPKTISLPIQFDPVIPEVRLIGSGVITPYQEEVIFPFEAKGLHAVDVEIFEIFENNVLQYLQSNRLIDHPYYLEQVGRIIHQEKIQLDNNIINEKYGHWARYVLDLQQFTAISPGALYVIRVGFRQAYTNYPCKEGVGEAPLDFNPENPQSILRWNYNYDGYRYEHESNPCYPVYYNENRFIERNVLASNLGIIAKMGEDRKLSVHVNEIGSAKPVTNAIISLYDFQKQILAEYPTDAEGKTSFELSKTPSFIVVNKGREYGYLNIMDRNANSLSDFDIGGLKKKHGINGYIYGERGVWRPGDTMYLTFVLEDDQQALPDDHPVSLIVNDARGQMKYQKTSNSSFGGMYTFKVPTEASDNTGAWNAIATVGNNSFSKRLRVETIKPNRLKINLEITNNTIIGDGVKIPFSSTWLHGAVASNLPATVDITFGNTATSFPLYNTYQFIDPARKLEATAINVFKGNLDNNGNGVFTIKENKSFLPPGKVNLRVKTRVFEPSGEYSEDNNNATVHRYKSYVGIKSPESRWGSNILEREGDDNLSLVVVDIAGEPIPNRKVNVGLYEADWQWWYSRSGSNIYRYDAADHLGAVSKVTLETDEKGLISWRPKSFDGYRYLVRACDDVSGHCTGILFYTSSYEDHSNEGGASILRLTADKNSYSPGETITLNVPSNNISRILISLEGGNGIVKETWYNGQENNTDISIPVENGMTPNVYIHAMLVQKYNNGSDLPLRMYGVLPLKIEDPLTVLTPVIKAPSEIKPKKNYTIEISEKEGKEMNYTLAVVDEGLLGLTRHKTPDLHQHFYAKQSLGVKTWDVYDMVLQGYGKDIEKHISIGGDSEIAGDPGDRKANRFTPVVDFLGPFHLKKGEKINHTLSMDNYMGEVRVMVVAKNKKSYGSSSVSVPVVNPIMLLATVPRVLSPEEGFDLPVTIFTTKDDIKNVTVKLQLGPGLSTSHNKSLKVNLSTKKEELIHFPVLVSDYQGPSFIKVTGNSGGESIDQRININIENPNPYSYKVLDKKIESGATITIPYVPIGISGTNSGTLELSTFPAINLDSRLDYLIRYPYGCIEQTTSSVFPQLYLEHIVELSLQQKNSIADNIQKGINRIVAFQQSNGGLSYWKGGREISEWGTSYAGHFLVEAQEKGYFVPDYFLRKWTSFQKNMVKKFSNSLNHSRADLMQAYRLYTLSRSGNPEWAAMNFLRNENLDKTSRYVLAAAYAAAAKPNIAQLLIEGSSYSVDDYQEMSYTYGSSIRDKALVAESFLNIPGEIDNNTESLVREVALKLGESSWYSTQTTAFGLLAVGKYLSKVKVGQIDATVTLNNGIPDNINSSKAISQRSFEIEKSEKGNVKLKNNSSGVIYARIILKGQEQYGSSVAKNENLKLIVKYTDMQGKSIDISELKQGTDFISEVTVINPGSRNFELEELALTQAFPSGWEIQNDRISGNSSTLKSDTYDYIDIRDDRINIFFDLNTKKTFRTLLTATYSGKYFLPDVHCVAMYDQKVSSQKPGHWVSITTPVVQ